jgi:hypothetical protein
MLAHHVHTRVSPSAILKTKLAKLRKRLAAVDRLIRALEDYAGVTGTVAKPEQNQKDR